MTLYDKDEAVDLSAKQKKVLKTAIDAELKARQAKQLRRRMSRSTKSDG